MKNSLILDKDGLEWIPDFLPADWISAIRDEWDDLLLGAREQAVAAHGIRNAEKKLAVVKRLLASDLMQQALQRFFTGCPQLVRAILFDKTADKNWLVSWHQDKTIAVNRRCEVAGWGPWSVKDDIHHVQPDLQTLNRMKTFRLHLDDCDENNGCLKVIPGSQQEGILSHTQIQQLLVRTSTLYCPASAGDLLVMHPLLLHASAKAGQASHRRVVHLEFNDCALPNGLQWA